MKKIISSGFGSALYYASGMADGNGLTAGSPRLWHEASADGGATVPWTGSETTPIFVALSLTGGIEYTFSFSFNGGDMYGYISTPAAPGTILQYLYYWDVMSFTPDSTGIYLLQVGYDMTMELMDETIGCSPQPQVIPTGSGWQRRALPTSAGVSRYGKLTYFEGYRRSPVNDGIILDFIALNGLVDVSPSKQPIITIGRPLLCGGMLYLDANSYFQLPILLTGNAARSLVVTMRITGHGPFLGAGRTGYSNQDWTVYTSDTRIMLNGWNNDHTFSTTVPFSGFVTFGLSYTNGSLEAYLQGNPVFSAAPNAFDTFADNPWFFGGAPNGNRGKAVGFFPCCQIYNRFLSADEHAELAAFNTSIVARMEALPLPPPDDPPPDDSSTDDSSSDDSSSDDSSSDGIEGLDVSGAGYTASNGIYPLDDPQATGTARTWHLDADNWVKWTGGHWVIVTDPDPEAPFTGDPEAYVPGLAYFGDASDDPWDCVWTPAHQGETWPELDLSPAPTVEYVNCITPPTP